MAFLTFLLSTFTYPQNSIQEARSENFKVIYYNYQSNLVGLVLSSAENSYNNLKRIFNYTPTQKIIIDLTDASDYGYGATITVPQDFIRVEIEPLEPGYEQVIYTNSIPWIISHELVHVFYNDMSNRTERFGRKIFGRVSPEVFEPLTVPFSLLTNYNRFSPRWHQEGIAVFLETWQNGGYGRALGSFYEMYFRSLVYENKEFPSPISLETKNVYNSILFENLDYLYGTRFDTYIAKKFGVNKLISWYNIIPGDSSCFLGYSNFECKFYKIFGESFEKAWNDFVINEKKFQNKNISKLKSSELTNINNITQKADGWVTKAYFDKESNSVIYGFHKPAHLASLKEINLNNHISKIIGTIPTPSLMNVASTAYDSKLNLFFYTTKNNNFYRDVRVLNLSRNPKTSMQNNSISKGDSVTDNEKLLFEDCRMGDLTVSPETDELWGVIHSDGVVALSYSPFPYNKIIPLIQFDVGDVIYDLSLSPSGRELAAVLHRANGSQVIVLANVENIKKNKSFQYQTIYSKGSPEDPSWDDKGENIFFNAYTNGVSNIYKYNLETEEVTALSDVITGLFKPVYLNKDSLFAFEFTSDGFVPSIIPNKSAKFLPAINYFGEKIVDKYPEVKKWNIDNIPASKISQNDTLTEDYNSLNELRINTIIPVVTGFQNQKVLGLYLHISDPLVKNDLKIETGYSPFGKFAASQRFHLKADYDFNDEYQFSVNYNEPNFYDLFDSRKVGLAGTKLTLGDKFYWIYNNPLKLKQQTTLSIYRDFNFLYDNLVKVSQPNFLTLETNLNLKNLRRSIGSIYYEEGSEFNFNLKFFGSELDVPNIAAQVFGSTDFYTTWMMNHNIFHLQASAGYLFKNDNIYQSRFFLGGFGNREVDGDNINQYRETFRFPGIPIYSLSTSRFLKIMLENDFPPVRFDNLSLLNQILSYSNLSVFSHGLTYGSRSGESFINAGAQINFQFLHWYNLESTLSAGIADSWNGKKSSFQWFISYKLFKEIL